MSTRKERVFITGATGAIGSGVVRSLVKQGVDTTAYVRNEEKAKDLFQDELKSNHLTLVIGTYSTIDVYRKAIEGHTRLFLLLGEVNDKPVSFSRIKETFAKIAFEQGVRQVIDLSSASVGIEGKKGVPGYAHTLAEEKLCALADENPEQRSLVILRPGSFMSNHFMGDVHHIKRANKIASCASPSSTVTWTDTKDISDCAVIILTESVEKHDRNIYEMGGDCLTNEQRAALFSKVLGKPITYEQQSIEDFYKAYTGFGLSHSFVYYLLLHFSKPDNGHPTPEIAVVLHRPMRTLEEWLKEHVQAFQ